MAEADFTDPNANPAGTGEGTPGEEGTPNPGAADTGAGGADGGHMSYQEWVDAGNDPDMYQGKKAFEMNRQEIQDKRKYRKDLQSMQQTLDQTVQGINDWKSHERARIKTEVQAELAQAMEDEDPQAAVTAQKKLDAIEQQEQAAKAQPQQQQYVEPEVLLDWRAKHPLVDGDSEQFNQEFNDAMVGYFNADFAQLSQGGRKQLTDGQMERIANKAYNQAKGLYPDLFQSPRNTRQQSQQRSQRRAPAQGQSEDDQVQTADNYVIPDPVNPRQQNAASEVAQMVRSTAEENARRTGKSADAIKSAGDEAVAEFEKNLFRGT